MLCSQGAYDLSKDTAHQPESTEPIPISAQLASPVFIQPLLLQI